jgi:hypothetical protein
MSPKHQYPPFYEKAVPIILGIIVIAIILLLLIVLGIALNLIPGAV